MKNIRCKAIVIFRYQDKFLFTDCFETTTGQEFYIPPGGGVEFGEHSSEAARREVMEETGEEVENLKLLKIEENIFFYNGADEHEIVFIYCGELKNKQAYTSSLKGGMEASGKEIKLVWASINKIKEKRIQLYPEGLLEILEELQEA